MQEHTRWTSDVVLFSTYPRMPRCYKCCQLPNPPGYCGSWRPGCTGEAVAVHSKDKMLLWWNCLWPMICDDTPPGLMSSDCVSVTGYFDFLKSCPSYIFSLCEKLTLGKLISVADKTKWLHWNFLWDRKSHIQDGLDNMKHSMVLKEGQAAFPQELFSKVG